MSVNQLGVHLAGAGIGHTGAQPARVSGRVRLVRPAEWALSERPARAIAYVVGVDVAALVVVLVGVLVHPIPRTDWIWLGVLLACVVLYTEASRPIERIREHYAGGPHIDLNSVWMFASVLLLHPALAATVISASYAYRWLRVRHHIVHRQTFSAAAAIISGYASWRLLTALSGTTFTDMERTVGSFLIVVAAGAVFMAATFGFVTVAITITTPKPRLRSVLSAPGEYALEAATLALAILLAWALVEWQIALVLIVGITLVLHRNVLIRQLRDKARTDSKTGLLNAAGWSTEADAELNRATRTGSPTSLLVIDLDSFKAFNDTYGHLAGDEILRAVADTISAEVRAYDIVGRFGGEEFVVMLPGTNVAETAPVAERIRRRVETLTIPAAKDANLTVSIGLAVVPQHANTLTELLHSADMAMYAAKEAGRNQIRMAERPAGDQRASTSANGHREQVDRVGPGV